MNPMARINIHINSIFSDSLQFQSAALASLPARLSRSKLQERPEEFLLKETEGMTRKMSNLVGGYRVKPQDGATQVEYKQLFLHTMHAKIVWML